jgi:hypothetical protein
MIVKQTSILSTWLLVLLLLSGCATTVPKEALELSPESLKLRQLQTKSFDTNEKTLLTSSASLLQDLGFNIEETSSELGVITSSKRRDATSTSQIVGAIFVALLTGTPTPVDKEQLIRASVVTHPINIDEKDKSNNKTAVRVTFQRVVTNTQGQVTRRECIIEEQIYKEFFDKLSKSLFLEAYDI